METLGELAIRNNGMVGTANVHGGDRYTLRLRKRDDTVLLHAGSRRGYSVVLGMFPASETLDLIRDMMVQHPRAGRWTIRLVRHHERPTMRDYPVPGAYVAAWKRGKEHTARGGLIRMEWPCSGLNAQQFDCEMLGALNRRINERGGIVEQGRKYDPEWQTECRRDCYRIRDHFQKRIITRLRDLSTPELRQRYAGRIPADYSEC